MADPWSILANARANTPDLGQVYMGAQRQRIADMMSVRRMEADERKAQREHDKDVVREKVGGLAASGDNQGARSAALEAGEFDLVKALDGMDDSARTTAGKRADAIGAAALFVQSQPESARPALWDDAIRNLSSQGYSDLDRYIGQYSPEALSGIIASSGATKEYFAQANKPQRAPSTRERIQGGNVIQEELGADGVWRQIGTGPRWNPRGGVNVNINPTSGIPTNRDDLDAKYGGQ